MGLNPKRIDLSESPKQLMQVVHDSCVHHSHVCVCVCGSHIVEALPDRHLVDRSRDGVTIGTLSGHMTSSAI